ncbi:type II toxin-antitoxin system RelE/ParE family toxin [Roseomonas aeriglobus]|nr:type II toxin-antitoxin system RelE/ParE family toxin [Roseomonas aeriglobus]
MKIVWTPQAVADRDPVAAVRMDQRFSDAVAGLAEFPLRGHPGEVAGTRELTPHRSYRLVYEVVDDTVWILVLIHSARLWPPLSDIGAE